MASNMNIYNESREVPKKAQKTIKGGRLSGMTDINPMWRIKKLTELFGPCGFGWRYEIVDKKLNEGANNEIAAFVDINLYIKVNDEWSEAIPGTGGSTFVAKERKGMHTSDECFKMALTDAISIACKALGIGADIYWGKDTTKYSKKDKKKKNKKLTQDITLKSAREAVITFGKKYNGDKLENCPEAYLNWLKKNFEDERWCKRAELVLEWKQGKNSKKKSNKPSGRQKEIKDIVGDDEELQSVVIDFLAEERPKDVKKKEFSVDKLSNTQYKTLLETLDNMKPDDEEELDIDEENLEQMEVPWEE